MARPAPVRAQIQFGPYVADLRTGELRKHGIRLKLQDRPFQILAMLLERPGEVVTREEIRARLWPDGLFVDFDNNINSSMGKLRAVLGDSASSPRYIETAGRGYRFLTEVQSCSDEHLLDVSRLESAKPENVAEIDGSASIIPTSINHHRRSAGALALAIVLVGVLGLWSYYHFRTIKPLTEQDTIVIADFANHTGDPLFDGTLKQALTLELTQSPFLSVASDLQVGEVLQRMGRSFQNALNRETAAEVCLRMGGKALLAGTITTLGSRYLVGLEALGCSNGKLLAAAQAQAENKDDVLHALGRAASQVRAKLGESLGSLQKYDFPVNATTKSLEALRAFSMGLRAERDSGPIDAIPFYKEAVQLDPDFALAYATLGRAYEDFGQDEEARRDYAKAFELRERLSERERYFVTTLYYETVPGDLEKAKEAGELWTANYPQDGYAHEKLGTVYSDLGEQDKAHDQVQEALRLDPQSETNIFNAVLSESSLERWDEAERILARARSEGLDGEGIHSALYLPAFHRGDFAEMERLVAWAVGKPGIGEILLAQHADTQAYFGRIHKARELSSRATKAAIRDKAAEIAALYQVIAALREIEIGNVPFAGQYVHRALALARTRDVKVQAALAWARSGNARLARDLLNEAESESPENTLINSYWAPAIEASVELQRGNPETAISKLQIVTPYEMSAEPIGWVMYPTYIRGRAYLALHNGGAAVAEFKKIVDHPGVFQNCIVGALSRLQLARAEFMAGDRSNAVRNYEEFLTLWKDADPDLPILKQAKAEYAKLR